MMAIKCFELKTPTCGHDYFNGGYGEARDWEVEHFATEAEAMEALEAKKVEVRKNMAWAGWWVEKYAKDEAFTVREVVVKF